eukprot:scaffold120155_cov15-Tisochrysis_lutea.AAC.1
MAVLRPMDSLSKIRSISPSLSAAVSAMSPTCKHDKWSALKQWLIGPAQNNAWLKAALPRVSDMNNNFTCMDNVSTTAQQLGFFTTCPSTGLRRV